MSTNEIIVKVFYSEYYRPPRTYEFEALGGRLNNVRMIYGNYDEFLKTLGYPVPTKSESFDLVNIRTNEVELVGSYIEIAEELGVHRTYVRRLQKQNKIFRYKYKLVLKPFKRKKMLELIQKEINKEKK